MDLAGSFSKQIAQGHKPDQQSKGKGVMQGTPVEKVPSRSEPQLMRKLTFVPDLQARPVPHPSIPAGSAWDPYQRIWTKGGTYKSAEEYERGPPRPQPLH